MSSPWVACKGRLARAHTKPEGLDSRLRGNDGGGGDDRYAPRAADWPSSIRSLNAEWYGPPVRSGACRLTQAESADHVGHALGLLLQ